MALRFWRDQQGTNVPLAVGAHSEQVVGIDAHHGALQPRVFLVEAQGDARVGDFTGLQVVGAGDPGSVDADAGQELRHVVQDFRWQVPGFADKAVLSSSLRGSDEEALAFGIPKLQAVGKFLGHLRADRSFAVLVGRDKAGRHTAGGLKVRLREFTTGAQALQVFTEVGATLVH